MQSSVYAESVARQREQIPEIYGDVDFSIVPERYDAEANVDDERFASMRSTVARVLGEPETMRIIRDATMAGDRLADAYAALIPERGLRRLVELIGTACSQGLDAIDGPPPELVALIESMEATPAWVDMDLVRRGARAERIPMATATPFAIRGAFLATFLNQYAALPMTMTGTLSDEAAAKRVFETASFFTATTLPGALERHGKGFEAAAKVRLMHSMVRFHLLRSGEWDVSTYGIPIPQVDQMPAGLIGVFLLSVRVLGAGRTEFTEAERAQVELSRYRCFLLGLPEALLGATPVEIVDLLTARHVSLREAYDDEICGSLIRGTMAADLFDRSTPGGRIHTWLENGFSRFVLIKSFLGGDVERAAQLGIGFGTKEKVAAGVAAAAIGGRTAYYRLGLQLPVVGGVVDRQIDARLADLLDSYGHADFVTEPHRYKDAAPAS